MFAITSEPQSLATEAEDDWALGYPAIGDPHHEIRETSRDRDLVDVFYNEDAGHLRERPWASHPKGYYQPAVLGLHKSGRVLYPWRCVPKYSNMSGAGGRPEARYTWGKVKENLTGSVDAELDRDPPMGSETVSWPFFLMILFAHGWFIRPKVFPLGRDSDSPSAKPSRMLRRVYGFVALWVLLLVTLPLTWVGVAFLAWIAVATPGLIEIHRQFQNEPEAY